MTDRPLYESGRFDTDPEPLNLCDAAETLVDRMYTQASAKGLRLRFHADAPQIWALLDPADLDRLLYRLIDRAIERTERGHVTVGVQQRPDHVELCVEDTGHTARTPDGPALDGVPESLHDLARRLGGTLDVDAASDRGHTCTVRFRRPSAALPASGSAADDMLDMAYRARVLVIDSNPRTPSYLGLLLGRWCRIVTAADDADALRLVRRQRFDLVLLNVDGQDSAGLELMESLRGIIGKRRIAVIALTAHPYAGEQSIFLDAGFDGYIGLPFGADADLRGTPPTGGSAPGF